MPISKELLPLFNDFVRNYKHNGTPSFFNWTKEQNHGLISQFFEELLSIINANQELFNDTSIIEHLNVTVLLSAHSNPYLLECWISFLTKYNATTKIYAAIGSVPLEDAMHIKVHPEGTPSEHMVRDLKKALEATQQALALAQKAHSTEIEMLKRDVARLREEHTHITAENQRLKSQVYREQFFSALHPKIALAQEQMSALTGLLQTLDLAAQQKPPIPTLNQEAIATAPPQPAKDILPPQHQVTRPKSPAPIAMAPKAPPPPPPRMPPPTHSKQPVVVAPKPAKKEPKPTTVASDSSLFNELAKAVAAKRKKITEHGANPIVIQKRPQEKPTEFSALFDKLEAIRNVVARNGTSEQEHSLSPKESVWDTP